MNDYLTENLTFLYLNMHTNTILSSNVCPLPNHLSNTFFAPRWTYYAASFPNRKRGLDEDDPNWQLCWDGAFFFPFAGEGRWRRWEKTHTDSTLWGRVTLAWMLFDLQCKKERTGSRQNISFLGGVYIVLSCNVQLVHFGTNISSNLRHPANNIKLVFINMTWQAPNDRLLVL